MIAPQPSSLFSWQDPLPHLPFPLSVAHTGWKATGSQRTANCELNPFPQSQLLRVAVWASASLSMSNDSKRGEKKWWRKHLGSGKGRWRLHNEVRMPLRCIICASRGGVGIFLINATIILITGVKFHIFTLMLQAEGDVRDTTNYIFVFSINIRFDIFMSLCLSVYLSLLLFVCPLVRSSIWKFRS